ncbi:MAG: biotin--[acetyl-CoA-carboxylase] ligase [Caldilineaceae bacterium]|nr:biotin--[acetyl-CoA-carboxylase] ligase [Caldilineaceae bacterium]
MDPDFPILDLTFIRNQLAHSPVGHTLFYHTSVPSTMPIAAGLARNPDTPSGSIVVAEEQTSGRGRQGRSWQAPYASALLVSIVLKPPQYQLPATTLTMLAGNALMAAVTAVVPELQPDLQLKWPNDLLLGDDPGRARKLAGILAESSLQPDGSIAHATLGIGINVNQRASDLPRIAPPTPRPTSLRVATGKIIDRSYLLVELCRQLAEGLALPPTESYRRWKAQLSTLGQSVAVYPHGPTEVAILTGQAIDVQEDGAIIVEDATGARHTFHAADISIRALT